MSNRELFERNVAQTIGSMDAEKIFSADRQLIIKYGVDATAPFLHLGHAVNLWMMRELQDIGHKVVFLIGDYTTQIGDPTGKSSTRPILSKDEINLNAEAFIEQVGIVLRKDPDLFEVRRNSEWFDTMSAKDMLDLLSMVSHAHLISRDMFQERIANGHEIRMHEMIYPILQGYDSAVLKSDLTIVGSDQLFNESMGRFFQEKFGIPQLQTIITSVITAGIDGKAKQSKSLGNYIALADTPTDKFGKAMSIPDHLIIPYLSTYTGLSNNEISKITNQLEIEQQNPMIAKSILAYEIVARYHGTEIATQEKELFLDRYSRKTISAAQEIIVEPQLNVLQLVQAANPEMNFSKIRTLFNGNAISIDMGKISPATIKADKPHDAPLDYKDGSILKVGKKQYYKLKIL
ncbi:MAG: tyrosine--tRNA ligase [Alphaproteobacteria bacterium]